MRKAIMIAVLFASAGCSLAPDTIGGDAQTGRQVANDLCASCHAVSLADASPNAAAPPLRDVLRDYSAEQLADDLESSKHIAFQRMPQFFFGANHARDVVAYIQTLSPRAH